MQDPYLKSVLEAIASEASDTETPLLITVDELRAAGALDVPAAWRKSLSDEEDPGLFGGNDASSEEQLAGDVNAKVDDPSSS